MNSKKIVICIPNLNVFGGTEIQTLFLVRFLSANGFVPIVCCYFLFDKKVVSKFEELNVEVVCLKLRRSNPVHFIKNMFNFFNKVKPNIVHVQYVAPGLLPIIAAKLAGIKSIFATVHQPCRAHGWQAKFLLRFGAFLCDAFFCVSKATEESWFGDWEIFDPRNVRRDRRHFTIYNGIDVAMIEKIAKEADTEGIKESLNIKNKKVIGVVGRLRSEKGHSVLLNAMVEVIKVFPDSILVIIGDGPDRHQLEQMAIQLGINDHVLWLGQKNPDEVFQLYSIMDVVAVPSLFEGFGLSAAEAMTAGRPVVASDVDGLSEVVDNGVTGYLIPPSNIEAFAKALIDLLSNPLKASKMGKIGRQRVAKYFSIQHFANSILSAYDIF